MKNVAIILGAGTGSRMKIDKNKVLLKIGNETIIEKSVNAFLTNKNIDRIIVVCKENELEEFKRILIDERISFVLGGATRQESVFNAVQSVKFCDYLIIHDGARPFVSQNVINDTFECAKKNKSATTGVFVKDTIKVVDLNNKILETPERSTLVSVQTPQIFEFELYKKAMKNAKEKKVNFTDDCQLIEAVGVDVFVSLGDYSNIKITTKDDLKFAEQSIKGG